MSIDNLVLFSAACLALAAVPGPDMIYLISRSLAQGPKAAFISLAGITAGGATHATAAGLGLSAIFLAAPILYDIVRYAGAAYLLYLAWQILKTPAASDQGPRNLPHSSNWALFRQGMITNLLNPKVALFFIALFPQFLNPGSSIPVMGQVAILYGILCLICNSYNAVIIITVAQLRRFGRANPLWSRLKRWFLASIFGGLALRLMLVR